MKKSLLLISIISFSFYSCHNARQTSNIEKGSNEKKHVVESEPNILDTTKSDIQVTNPMTSDSLQKTNSKVNDKPKQVIEAPKHNSPQQSKIDSIKKAKEHMKK